MRRRTSTSPDDLVQGLTAIVHSPLKTIIPPWSWKAAFWTALFRALTFFVTNLRAGRGPATKAMLVEALFAVFAGGLIGAVSQYLRRARPLWATAILVCLVLPALMTLAQFGVHLLAKTPHEGTGIFATFCLASIASAYTWYAMRQGALLGGSDQTSIRHDIQSLPRITLGFALSLPRWFAARLKRNSTNAGTAK